MRQPYRFLLDESVRHLKGCFPRHRAITTTEAGLRPNASDAEVVKKAWDLQYIIVTANGDDFVREIRRFQRQMMRANCRDLRGLVVVPDGSLTQTRALRQIARSLRFGGRPIGWEQVNEWNLYVRVQRSSSPEIRRFPRCRYCSEIEL